MAENDWFEKLCRTGQILWRKHELMRDEFNDANSEDCLKYEVHIKYCMVCKKALGLIK